MFRSLFTRISHFTIHSKKSVLGDQTLSYATVYSNIFL